MFNLFRLDHAEDARRWDAFVDANPQGTPFHLSGWLKTISRTYGSDPWLFVLKNEAGAIRALAPFIRSKSFLGGYSLVSLPFSDFCYPLGAEKGDIAELVQGLTDKHQHGLKRIEIRGGLAEPLGFAAHSYYKRHTLRLDPDPQAVLKGIDKRTIQYNIRKAKREGVEIREDNTPSGVEQFYKLYILTRKKHGVPHQPQRFFQALSRNLIETGRASVLLASHQSRVVAAGVFMKHGKTLFYKYNVSDPASLTKIVPNHLLTWSAIEKACLEGYEILDFGRSAPDNLGLMRYKRMWGAESQDLPYSYYPASAGALPKAEKGMVYKFATGMWRRLPESVISRVGPFFLKYFA